MEEKETKVMIAAWRDSEAIQGHITAIMDACETNYTDTMKGLIRLGIKSYHEPKKSKRFKKPTQKEVEQHMMEKGCIAFTDEAEKFIAFYDSNNWKVGKNKMANWKAAATGWVKRNNKKAAPKDNKLSFQELHNSPNVRF